LSGRRVENGQRRGKKATDDNSPASPAVRRQAASQRPAMEIRMTQDFRRTPQMAFELVDFGNLSR